LRRMKRGKGRGSEDKRGRRKGSKEKKGKEGEKKTPDPNKFMVALTE